MAMTTIATGDAQAAKLWAKSLFRDTLAKTWFGKFMGEGSGSIVQVLTEPQKQAGDKVTVSLRMQLSGEGRTGTQVLEGNEEDLTFYSDTCFVDLQRHAAKTDTIMSEQRTGFNLRKECKDALSDWWAKKLDTTMFRYLTGDTSCTYAGNTGVVTDTAHDVFASTCTAESQITTAHVFTIDLIDKAVYLAKTNTPLIRPVRVEGEEYYALVLHPRQVYDLRTSTATGAWLDLHKAEMMGGKIKDNPIFTGAIGIYNGCIIYEATNQQVYLTGSSSARVARGVLLGAQAGVVAFGMGYSKEGFKWNEELIVSSPGQECPGANGVNSGKGQQWATLSQALLVDSVIKTSYYYGKDYGVSHADLQKMWG